jgi:hypothetical protein
VDRRLATSAGGNNVEGFAGIVERYSCMSQTMRTTVEEGVAHRGYFARNIAGSDVRRRCLNYSPSVALLCL